MALAMPHVEGVEHRYADVDGLRVHYAEAGERKEVPHDQADKDQARRATIKRLRASGHWLTLLRVARTVPQPFTLNDISVAVLVFDDQEKVYSTSFHIRCYNQVPLSTLRVLSQGLNSIVPAGRTGWMRMNAGGLPLLGAVLTKGGIFNGAHNLHQLALTNYSILVPSF